ncbi:XRE family transcriptional regulator [Methanocella sp. CWC-04]|uniref:XRE family transcriptional regulator n=1 Tax=Methanooceanicella nereidis TaxID=2052831 RepID=A0AAP2RCZ3_9EURY|nr:helix-turn-helix transcriptional regulator [Methanocella sp. CWC-04]MCD1294365.1 XRE family transcriptional regulator [Methanocella sp. CWC-04]
MYAPDWIIELSKKIAGDIVTSSDRGITIQRYRNKMDLTQDDISRIMKLRRETISRIENGKVTPTLKFITVFSGVAALTETVKSYRSMNKSVEYPYFNRIGMELGVPHDKISSIVDITLQNYEKKRKKAIKALEK